MAAMAAMAAMVMLMMDAVTWGTGALFQHQCEAAVTGTHWSTVYPQGFWLARLVGAITKYGAGGYIKIVV